MISILDPIPPVDPIDFGIDVITTILGALSQILGLGGSTGPTQQQFDQLVDATQRASDWNKRFAWTIASALGAVLQALHNLFVGVLDALKNLVQRLGQLMKWLLQTGIPKLLKIIHDLRAWLAKFYQKYMRPVLIYLQMVRKYLAILRLLHVGFAAKLDQWLANIQGKILLPFVYVMRSLNGVGTWVNLIVTVGGIIQRAVFINTMYAYQNDWINMWWTGQLPAGGTGPGPKPPTPYTAPTQAEVTAGVTTYAQTGLGEYADYAALSRQALFVNSPQIQIVN